MTAARNASEREIFAHAERLAWWHCITLGGDRHEVAAALKAWRNANSIWISDSALKLIAAHVTEAAAAEVFPSKEAA